ncbi:MAG: FHA domain-containing protein [Myxococcota bacterium]
MITFRLSIAIRWPDNDVQEHTLRGRAFVIGRAEGCEIVIEHDAVSRRHARLVVTPEGELWVEDARSTSGTFLNDDLLAAPRPFTYGDVLRVGEARIVLLSAPQRIA